MTDKPTYTFLPWARLGVANSIQQDDNDASVKLRASVPVTLVLETRSTKDNTKQPHNIDHTVKLYGPGDIIGIDDRAIVRNEPQHWTTSFESNLLAYAEFHDPDFPWRYTPAKATDKRLRPWIAVVALTEDEFEEVKKPGRPLPAFKLKTGKQASALFPSPTELWAWAHVHVNESLTGSSLDKSFGDDPDLTTARILCPRHLAANQTYHAFLIPSFEAGRLAGLGVDLPADLAATKSAWADGQDEFPYYHRWQFRTGFGDFEYLVRLLKPQAADNRVGIRDMDVMHTGPLLPVIDNPNIGGILKLGGALQVPRATMSVPDQNAIAVYENWDVAPHKFRNALAKVVDTPDDYVASGDPDPVVTSPLYGRWHALVQRILLERDGTTPVSNTGNWVHQLNLDPRYRVAAAFGTQVVQKHQEQYMKAAWDQVGDVLAANALLRLMQLARSAGARIYAKHLKPLDESRRIQLTAPVQKRVLVDGVTARHQIDRSVLPYASTAPAFRAMTRPRGKLAQRTGLTKPGAMAQVVAKLDAGALVSARPFAPAGGITFEKAKTAAATAPAPKNQPIDAATRAKLQQTLSAQGQSPVAVAKIPTSPNFVVTPPHPQQQQQMMHGPTDSPDAARFKTALTDAFSLAAQTQPVAQQTKVGTASLAVKVISSLDPYSTVPTRYRAAATLPVRLASVQVNAFVPAMAYPVIDTPMYKPLADISSELFVPNLKFIPHNSLTLLETNEPFIESYLVGLNHEMARELLWREFPTDQRGSVFRQFWDVSAVYPKNPPDDQMREDFRDIPRIHEWPPASTLRDHNQRLKPDPATPNKKKDPPIVLVVRGELLKRYPNTVIYARKAKWVKGKDGKPDRVKERELVDVTNPDAPSRDEVRTPLFEAKVSPDIYFIGFDLSAVQARGAAEHEAASFSPDNAGWFFCLQERPGEPRFGIDLPVPADVTEAVIFNSWNSLDWSRVGTPEGACIKLDKSITFDKKPGIDPQDVHANWNPQTTAAELAYILYQVPVLCAVHAHRMLPNV